MSILSDIATDECKMEMTPMIDVVFLLLIFFMCTIKFKVLEGKLSAYLPKDVGVNATQAEPIEKVEILMRVQVEGTKLAPDGTKPWSGKAGSRFVYQGPGTPYRSGQDRVIQYSLGPRKSTNLTDIQARLRDLHEKDPDRPATIDARQGITYADVVMVLDAAIDANYREITFIGAYPEKKAPAK
jgi:biopolymer transport protein ExbD